MNHEPVIWWVRYQAGPEGGILQRLMLFEKRTTYVVNLIRGRRNETELEKNIG